MLQGAASNHIPSCQEWVLNALLAHSPTLTCWVELLQQVVLPGRGSAPKVETVHHMAHVHPRVLKGVGVAAGGEVERAGDLLDQDKACKAVEDARLRWDEG